MWVQSRFHTCQDHFDVGLEERISLLFRHVAWIIRVGWYFSMCSPSLGRPNWNWRRTAIPASWPWQAGILSWWQHRIMIFNMVLIASKNRVCRIKPSCSESSILENIMYYEEAKIHSIIVVFSGGTTVSNMAQGIAVIYRAEAKPLSQVCIWCNAHVKLMQYTSRL